MFADLRFRVEVRRSWALCCLRCGVMKFVSSGIRNAVFEALGFRFKVWATRCLSFAVHCAQGFQAHSYRSVIYGWDFEISVPWILNLRI